MATRNYSTILDKLNGTSGPPLPPFHWSKRRFAPSRLHRCFGGGKGLIIYFYHFVQWQNKWNIWTNPPPISMMPKWCVFAPSRLHRCFGEMGGNCSILIYVFFYFDSSSQELARPFLLEVFFRVTHDGLSERGTTRIVPQTRLSLHAGCTWELCVTTGVSPAELLFRRKLRTRIPGIEEFSVDDQEVRERDSEAKEKGKLYAKVMWKKVTLHC